MTSERGIALITTLLITAVLVMVIAEFTFRVYLSASRAENVKNGARATLAAVAGMELAKKAVDELARRPDSVIDEEGTSFIRPIEEGLSLEVRLSDERAKASLRIVYPTTGVPITRNDGIYGRLVKELKLEDGLVDTLSDWIDADSEPRSRGAEGPDFYGRLPNPYRPKNNNLYSEDELLMIRGYSPEVYARLKPFVTAYTDGAVNINTAPREVLMALSDEVNSALADRVIDYRKKTPFRDRSDIMKVPGFEKIGFTLQDKITARSEVFRVRSRARAGDIVHEIEAVYHTGQTGEGILFWRED